MDWNRASAELFQKISGLGTKRLVSIAIAIALSLGTIAVSALYLTRPANEVLYAGLGRQEAGRVTAALKDDNIEFDLSADSSTIYVRNGQAPKARMSLAQKGLPNSTTNGYELFDKIGSFGLTTFMQDVTRLRAVEGELARTIQMLEGVRAARVHVVMPERASFRTAQQEPSASVVLQVDGGREDLPITAIRHLVASAVPRLSARNVSIINSNGALLASPDESEEQGTVATRRLEAEIARSVRKNIFDALALYLTTDGLRVSVAPRINIDRQEVAEKIFIPNTRVERSVRVIRESSDSQDTPKEAPTTVQQNLPRQEPNASPDRRKSEATQKREELTSYEISQRTTNTVTAGYRLEKLSIGVAINKASLPEFYRQPDKQSELKAHLDELEQLIKSVAGFDEKRGDTIKIALLDMPRSAEIPQAEGSSFLARNAPSFINGLILLLITGAVVTLGVRPIIRALNASPTASLPQHSDDLPALPDGTGGDNSGLESMVGEMPGTEEFALERAHHPPLIEMRDRLKRILESDEDTAVSIMKEWLAKGKAA